VLTFVHHVHRRDKVHRKLYPYISIQVYVLMLPTKTKALLMDNALAAGRVNLLKERGFDDSAIETVKL